MYNFFQKYFITPTSELSGYNIVNTLAYSLIFVGALYLLIYLIDKLKISINKQFIKSFLPFALFGILYRLRVDYGIVAPTLLTVTPGAWIIPFGIWISSIYLLKRLTKKDINEIFDYISYIGVILLAIFILFYPPIINNYTYFLGYFVILFIIFYTIHKENYYVLAFLGEFVDALGSYLGINAGFFEEHVFPRYIIENFGLVYYPIVKLLATVVVIYILSKLKIEENLRRLVLLVIFILGFGPGTRNWFLLMYAK